MPGGVLDQDTLLAMVERFDGDALTRVLASEWGRLGPMAFLQQRVAPLVEAVGVAWETGALEVRHEHFLSERVGDLLRAYHLPFDDRAHGPAVVLATLQAESSASDGGARDAMSGCRVCYVGTGALPRSSVAADVAAGAVGIGVSVATRGTGAEAVAKVRASPSTDAARARRGRGTRRRAGTRSSAICRPSRTGRRR
jgi:hypothetical protein